MERWGLVPSKQTLEAICQALGRPMSEALAVLSGDIATTSMVDEYITRYLEYKRRIIERERRSGLVGIFVLREDPEPVDRVSVQEHIDLLAGTEHTHVTLLFRNPDPRAWRSYYQLVGAIAQQLGEKGSKLLNRLRAFHRHPECAEQSYASLPMVHPYILTCDSQQVELASAMFDETVKQAEMLRGFPEPEATQRSLCVHQHARHVATQVAQWVGFGSALEPLANLWVPVVSTAA